MNKVQIRAKNPSQFSDQLKFVLDQITINENPKVVGSSAYTVHKYPSDVDVFEQVFVEAQSKEQALTFLTNSFQTMAKRLIIQKEKIFMNDFKAGLDERFDVEIPEEELARQQLVVDLGNKYNLNHKTVKKLFCAASNKNAFEEHLRQLKVLRWSLEELIAGVKTLIGHHKITLKDALDMNTIVKIDTIAWISGRFQAVEAFYNLNWINEDGEIKPFQVLNNYVEGLLADIEKYSSPENWSPLKVIKRTWSLSRVIKCQDMLEALNPALSSDAAALNQINSDAEILMELLKNKNLTQEQKDHIFVETLTFIKRAHNHLHNHPQVEEEYYQTVSKAYDIYDNKEDNLEEILEKSRKILMPVINQTSQRFLEEINNLNITCKNPRFQDETGLQFPSIYS